MSEIQWHEKFNVEFSTPLLDVVVRQLYFDHDPYTLDRWDHAILFLTTIKFIAQFIDCLPWATWQLQELSTCRLETTQQNTLIATLTW